MGGIETQPAESDKLLVAPQSHLSGWFRLFAQKFWTRGGDLQMPFTIL